MDHHLFWLDADKNWDLACDHNQWMLRKRQGKVTIGKHIGEPRQKAVWFVGSEKQTLLQPITGTDPRWKVELTAGAHALFDALPDRFLSFRSLAYQGAGDSYEFVGWEPEIKGVVGAKWGLPQTDLAKTGT